MAPHAAPRAISGGMFTFSSLAAMALEYRPASSRQASGSVAFAAESSRSTSPGGVTRLTSPRPSASLAPAASP